MKKGRVTSFAVLVGFMVSLSLFAIKSEGAGKAAISDGKSVKAHYTLTVDGKMLESSKGKDPIQFKMGSKQMIPGFEKAVMGMKVGQKKSFKVSPQDGYGLEDPKAFQNVPKSQLPKDITPKAGMTLYAKRKDGQDVPVRVAEVKKDVVVMNFNHPLAGKTLNFDVEIVEIK